MDELNQNQNQNQQENQSNQMPISKPEDLSTPVSQEPKDQLSIQQPFSPETNFQQNNQVKHQKLSEFLLFLILLVFIVGGGGLYLFFRYKTMNLLIMNETTTVTTTQEMANTDNNSASEINSEEAQISTNTVSSEAQKQPDEKEIILNELDNISNELNQVTSPDFDNDFQELDQEVNNI